MPANYAQVNFLGGEISGFADGRTDIPQYKISLAQSLNGMPLEEGVWVRRPGSQRIIPTYKRRSAKLLEFVSTTSCAFVTEVTTDGTHAYLRFISGTSPIFTNDAQTISAASYSGAGGHLTITTAGTHGWSSGDQFMIDFSTAGLTSAQEALCRGRVFMAFPTTSGTTVSLLDDNDKGLYLNSFPTGSLVGAKLMRLVRLTGPWLTDIQNLRITQAQTQAVIWSAEQPPQTLQVTEPTGSNDPSFTLSATAFVDGPYLDPQSDGGTVTGYTGSINFTNSGSYTFVASDVGRHIRLFTEPAAWNPSTNYSNGTYVTYNSQWWVAINAGAYASVNVGVYPGSPYTSSTGVQAIMWAPAPQAGQWGWGIITAIGGGGAPHQCTLTLQTTGDAPAGLNSANGTGVTTWRLGLLTSGVYPTCGAYSEGRLMMGGAVPNRFDMSMANQSFVFSPTDQYGNVNDDNAIDYTLNSRSLETILWMVPDAAGVLCGTLSGPWLIAASQLNDPITPTSIQAHKSTQDGSIFHEPLHAGMAQIFIALHGRKVMEYLADSFSGKFSARPINQYSLHLTKAGVAEIKYQSESQPVIWARTQDGGLIGCVYRRVSRFVAEPPAANGWFPVALPPGYQVTSIAVLPAESGLDDRLYLAGLDPNANEAGIFNQNGDGFIEMVRPFPEVEDTSQ